MSDESNTTTDTSTESNTDPEPLQVSETYKILGEFTASDGASVAGQNNASSGTPIGVQGAVASNSGYGLSTPDDARVQGELQTSSVASATDFLGFSAGGKEGLRLKVDDVHPDIIGGDFCSTSGTSSAATISGGLSNSAAGTKAAIGGGENNVADGGHGTIAGGLDNEITGDYGTIGGGEGNEITAGNATVGGGFSNRASGTFATVPGGVNNVASANSSFAAGIFAEAADPQAFVWNDGSGSDSASGSDLDRFSSSTTDGSSGVTGSETFHIKAKGGVRIITSGDNNLVTYIADGTAGWTNTSTRTAKTNVEPVDPDEALAGVESMPVSTWEYTDEEGEGAGTRHIGPMAEDFHDAFDVGDTDRAINSINADGVALAALQGLSAKLDEKVERIDDLEAENDALRERLAGVEDRLAAIEDESADTTTDDN